MKQGPRYRVKSRRRRQGKTDYQKRLKLLKSRKIRIIVRKSLKNTRVQFVEYHEGGDKILASAISNDLQKEYKWKYSTATVPAAYLTGLLAGARAKEKGINVEILPNKLIYDKKKDNVYVFDYYLNHGKCPFYQHKECTIYEDRPLACKKYPRIDNSYSKEVAEFVKKNKIDFSDLSYEDALKKCKEKIK